MSILHSNPHHNSPKLLRQSIIEDHLAMISSEEEYEFEGHNSRIEKPFAPVFNFSEYGPKILEAYMSRKKDYKLHEIYAPPKSSKILNINSQDHQTTNLDFDLAEFKTLLKKRKFEEFEK